MTTLPINKMICIPCLKCSRDQYVITDMNGTPVTYDGSGMTVRIKNESPDNTFDYLLNKECFDCERIVKLDIEFIIEQYFKNQVVNTVNIYSVIQC